MSPSHNNLEQTISNNLKNPITNSYIVHVGEQTFRLYRSSITFDSPNFFTQAFLGEDSTNNAGEQQGQQESSNSGGEAVPSSSEKKEINQKSLAVDNNNNKVIYNNANSATSNKEVILDRDPKLFEVILRYLRGYNIFPLSSINLPPGMSLDLFRESLLEDARFYGLEKLAQLLQAETPSPLSYKDPFTSTDKILLSLRDVPIHKDFIKSKLEDNENGNSTVEFFTGAVLTIELDASANSLSFKTKFLNEQDEKALETLGEIFGEGSTIELSRYLNSSWQMSDTLDGIRLEIDGVQVTGVDIASLVGAHNSRMKALEDMFRSSGGERLIIYAQEFVFRLDNRKRSNRSNRANSCNDDGNDDIGGSGNDVDVVANSDVVEHNAESNEDEDDVEEEEGAGDQENNDIIPNGKDKNVDGKGDVDGNNDDERDETNSVYLEVVWAKGWSQEWWSWNEYKMKLDTLQ